jgi:dCMP deaminase
MPDQDCRPGWDQYFMSIARLASLRSTCLRRKVGAVLVKNRRVLSTGYNGAPRNLAHCLEIGCLREQLKIKSGERHELCRAIHAEQNAVIQAAVSGVSIEGATIYCTTFPCVMCSKIIINSGIVRIICLEGYPDQLSRTLLDEAGIEVEYMDSSQLVEITEFEGEELP